MSLSIMERARVLNEALPYIQEFSGKIVVVKYGGNAMISENLRRAVLSDIVLLHQMGIRVVVVHGGGPEINDMLKKIGKEGRFVNGLRYTDPETMEIVQQVLCGKVSKDLVSVNTIAKDYGKSAIWLNKWLHDQKIQYRQGKVWVLYQRYAKKGYAKSRTRAFSGTDGVNHARVHTYWTQAGRLFIYNLLKENGILPLIEQEGGTA